MKKMMTLVLAMVLVLMVCVSALAETPVIKKVEYKGLGYVEVDFTWDVQYKDVQVIVADEAGNAYAASIWERDEDDLTFGVEGIVQGRGYTFTISGVRSGFSGNYESVSGSFTVPAEGEVVITEFDYDQDDRELEIDFNTRVEYENPSVEIRDASGAVYEARIVEMDRKGMELRVGQLNRGGEYTITVSGLRPEGSADSLSVSGNFTVR